MPTGSANDGHVSVAIGDLILAFKDNQLTIARQDHPDGTLTTDLSESEFEQLANFIDSVSLKKEEEKRITYRVPVPEGLPLQVLVSKDEETADATAIDISLSGILVEIAPEEPIALAVNDAVIVALALGGREVTLHGRVKRILPGRYGIFFVDTMKNLKLVPPPAFSRLVMQIQRAWLASQKESS